jgi:hypothetical protein
MTTSERRNEPTDKNTDNLAQQGLKNPNRHTPQCKSMLNRAELAGTVAALINEHTHIATERLLIMANKK